MQVKHNILYVNELLQNIRIKAVDNYISVSDDWICILGESNLSKFLLEWGMSAVNYTVAYKVARIWENSSISKNQEGPARMVLSSAG